VDDSQRPEGFGDGRMEDPRGATRAGQPSMGSGEGDAGGWGAARAPQASTGSSTSGKRILLIEDNPSDVALFLRAFSRGRLLHTVVVAADGQEALDRLHGPERGPVSNPSEFPDLILLDLKLPKVDGLEVLRRVRQNPRTRRIPVVILSSSTEYADLSAGYDLGANGYIRKPVSFDQFLSAVECLGHYWLGLNESPPRAV
jgi:two-component system response regulator